MRRNVGIVVAVLATVGLVFALGPSAPTRDNPEPTEPTGAGAPGNLVVDLQDGSTEADVEAIEAILADLLVDADGLEWTHELSVDEALVDGEVTDVAEALRRLAANELVEAAEPEIWYQLDPGDAVVVDAADVSGQGWPNDPMYDRQWNMRAMGAPDGWSHSPMGKGVTVAVVDTGVTRVEDLEGTEVLAGKSFVPFVRSADDDQGHGTHVAGTIAQTTHNGKGVAGIAPKAKILPVKVLNRSGMGTSAWIAAGIDYAVDEGADVINLSLGGSYSPVIHNAIKKARKEGVIVVAAAGNSGRKGVSYPGALKETIGVSALGPDNGLAPYSSWGKGVDISAPGGDKTKKGGGILQDTVGQGGKGHHYVEYQGTSMATPHVAGAAAVLLSTGSDADAVERILIDSADGASWDPKLGHGRLNLGAALGTVGPKHGGIKFGLGLVMALLIAQLAGGKGQYTAASAGAAAVTAGGLFFLAWLPLPGGALIDLLSDGVLSWPAVVLGPDWVHFPLWLSAALPAAIAFTLGAFRPTRWLATGVAVGFAAALFHGAATGTLDPWWMPWGLSTVWLVANGTACVLLAMGLAGTEKLDAEAAR